VKKLFACILYSILLNFTHVKSGALESKQEITQEKFLEPLDLTLYDSSKTARFLSPPSQVEAAVLAGILISGSLFCICFCKALNHFSFQQCCYHAWSHGNETEQADENV